MSSPLPFPRAHVPALLNIIPNYWEGQDFGRESGSGSLTSRSEDRPTMFFSMFGLGGGLRHATSDEDHQTCATVSHRNVPNCPTLHFTLLPVLPNLGMA
jgi:hypothetical protein